MLQGISSITMSRGMIWLQFVFVLPSIVSRLPQLKQVDCERLLPSGERLLPGDDSSEPFLSCRTFLNVSACLDGFSWEPPQATPAMATMMALRYTRNLTMSRQVERICTMSTIRREQKIRSTSNQEPPRLVSTPLRTTISTPNTNRARKPTAITSSTHSINRWAQQLRAHSSRGRHYTLLRISKLIRDLHISQLKQSRVGAQSRRILWCLEIHSLRQEKCTQATEPAQLHGSSNPSPPSRQMRHSGAVRVGRWPNAMNDSTSCSLGAYIIMQQSSHFFAQQAQEEDTGIKNGSVKLADHESDGDGMK